MTTKLKINLKNILLSIFIIIFLIVNYFVFFQTVERDKKIIPLNNHEEIVVKSKTYFPFVFSRNGMKTLCFEYSLMHENDTMKQSKTYIADFSENMDKKEVKSIRKNLKVNYRFIDIDVNDDIFIQKMYVEFFLNNELLNARYLGWILYDKSMNKYDFIHFTESDKLEEMYYLSREYNITEETISKITEDNYVVEYEELEYPMFYPGF